MKKIINLNFQCPHPCLFENKSLLLKNKMTTNNITRKNQKKYQDRFK